MNIIFLVTTRMNLEIWILLNNPRIISNLVSNKTTIQEHLVTTQNVQLSIIILKDQQKRPLGIEIIRKKIRFVPPWNILWTWDGIEILGAINLKTRWFTDINQKTRLFMDSIKMAYGKNIRYMNTVRPKQKDLVMGTHQMRSWEIFKTQLVR